MSTFTVIFCEIFVPQITLPRTVPTWTRSIDGNEEFKGSSFSSLLKTAILKNLIVSFLINRGGHLLRQKNVKGSYGDSATHSPLFDSIPFAHVSPILWHLKRHNRSAA